MFTLLALLAAPAAAAMDVGLRYVDGAVIPLSEAPGGEAAAWLQPGTPLRLLEVEGGQARVSLLERPPEQALEGWVPLSQIGARRPELTEPARPEVVDLARCMGGRAEWLGAVSPGGGLEDRLDEHVRERVARSAWFVEGADRPLRGSPFATPGFTEAGLDEGLSELPETAGLDGAGPVLVLGACDAEGALLSTAPRAAVEAVPLARYALELVDSMAVTIAETPVAIVDGVAVGPDLWAARYRDASGAESLLITDAHGRPMEAFGPAWHPEAAAGAWTGALSEPPTWLRLELAEGPALLMIAPSAQPQGEAVELMLVPEGQTPTRLSVATPL